MPPTPTERVGTSPDATRSLPVRGYLLTILTFALTLLGAVLIAQPLSPRWFDGPGLAWAFLAALLVLGELQPLVVLHRDGTSEPLTVSSTFALSLVIIAPLGLVLLAQTLAVTLNDLWRRRDPARAAATLSRHILTLVATRTVYALASGRPLLDGGDPFTSHDLFPGALAAATFLLTGNGLIALGTAVDRRLDPVRLLLADLRAQALTSAILLGLAPVAAVLAGFSPLMLPLLALPLAGVQRNARTAARRQHDALYDGLTGLPNRTLFRLRTEQAVADTRDGPGRSAVLLLDLDHFKEVNDTLGHQVGDELLRRVAERLADGLPGTVTTARLGGDEFAVLAPRIRDTEDARTLAEQMSRLLHDPVLVDGLRLGASGSIGVAVCPDHARCVDTLLQRADIALYDAKDNRGEIRSYRPESDQHTVQRLCLLGDLHASVGTDQFEMHYQPQVRTRDGAVTSVEALIRWRHPVHGTIRPDAFIPLAESTGLIAPLTRTTVRTSLRELAALHAAGHRVGLSVNISARLLSDLDLPRWFARALHTTAVPPETVTIEVTESTLSADPRRAMQVLRELREIGLRLSIDDFGTGYSSLSYLQKLQPDEVKVDRSFVTTLRSDENNAVIVRSTIELGHGLGMSVVAEGVEDTATYRALGDLGCDLIQGYVVARPMPADTLGTWLTGAGTSGWPGQAEATGPAAGAGSAPGAGPKAGAGAGSGAEVPGPRQHPTVPAPGRVGT
ncbi:MAG: bifunctional diguanylate cyclase/phosphodiesterase [Kineosporiaceae bacterium]